MHLPEMDPKRTKWETFKAFHVEHSKHHSLQFHQFDTGELLVQHNTTEPGARTRYPALNLEVVSTIDSERFPSLQMPDGTRVTRTHVAEYKNQTLLVDRDTGRVTSLQCHSTTSDRRAAGIPERFITGPGCWGSPTWFPGPGRHAITAERIIVSQPRPMTTATRAEKAQLIASCMMWAEMSFDHWPLHQKQQFVDFAYVRLVAERMGEQPYRAPVSGSLAPYHTGANISLEFEPGVTTFDRISVTQKTWVALNGKLPTKRVVTYHPYLMLAPTPALEAQETDA